MSLLSLVKTNMEEGSQTDLIKCDSFTSIKLNT